MDTQTLFKQANRDEQSGDTAFAALPHSSISPKHRFEKPAPAESLKSHLHQLTGAALATSVEPQTTSLNEQFDDASFAAIIEPIAENALSVSFGSDQKYLITKVEFEPLQSCSAHDSKPFARYGRLSFLADEPTFDGPLSIAQEIKKAHFFIISRDKVIVHVNTQSNTAILTLTPVTSVHETQMECAVSKIANPVRVASAAVVTHTRGIRQSVESTNVVAQEAITSTSLKVAASVDNLNKTVEELAADARSSINSWNFGAVLENIKRSFVSMGKSMPFKYGGTLFILSMTAILLIKIAQKLADMKTSATFVFKDMIVSLLGFFATLGVLIPSFAMLRSIILDGFSDLLATSEPLDSTQPVQESCEDEKESPRVYVTQGGSVSNMLSSLIAVSLAFARYLGNPSEFSPAKALAQVRKDSVGIQTINQAIEALTYAFPQEYRVAVYKKFKLGLPGEVPTTDQNVISRAFDMARFANEPSRRTPVFKEEFYAARTALSELVPKYAFAADDLTFVNAIIKEASIQMRNVEHHVSTIPDGGAVKLVPFGLWLYGPSGIGKTHVVTNIGDVIFGDNPAHLRTFADNSADQYSSGYQGQYIYYIDDVGSDAWALRQSGKIPQMLTWMSNFNVKMNMAFEKNISFSSHAVVASSNKCPEGIINSLGMTNPIAVKRRFTGSCGSFIFVEPKLQYRRKDSKGGIVGDVDKIAQMTATQKSRYEHLYFYVTRGETLIPGANHGYSPLSYEQFLTHVANLYVCKLQEYKEARIISSQVAEHLYPRLRTALRRAVADCLPAYENVAIHRENDNEEEKNHLLPSKSEHTYVPQMDNPLDLKSEPIIQERLEEPHKDDGKFEWSDDFDEDKSRLSACLSKYFSAIGCFLDAEELACGVLLRLRTMGTFPRDEPYQFADKISQGGYTSLQDLLRSDSSNKASLSEERVIPKFKVWMTRFIERLNSICLEPTVFRAGESIYAVKDTLSALRKESKTRFQSLKEWWTTATEGRIGLKHFALASGIIAFVAAVTVGCARLFSSSDAEDTCFEMQRKYRRKRRMKNKSKHMAMNREWANAYDIPDDYREYNYQAERRVTAATFPFKNALRRAQCRINFEHDGLIYSGRAWRHGTSILTNRHYFMKGTKNLEPLVKVTWCGQEFGLPFKWKDTQALKNTDGSDCDLMLWHTPLYSNQAIPTGPDISKHFVSEKNLFDYFGGATCINGRHAYLMDAHSTIPFEEPVELEAVPTDAIFGEGEPRVVSDKCYKYRHATDAGDCGMLLTDGQLLYGIHMLGVRCGGRIVEGLSQVITREMLTKATSTYVAQRHVFLVDNMASTTFQGFTPSLEEIHQGDVPIGFVPVATLSERMSTPTATRLVPTLLKGSLASSNIKVPAPLSKLNPTCPDEIKTSEKSFGASLQKKFSVRPPDFPPGVSRAVMTSIIDSVPPHFPARILELDEAMNPNFDGCLNPLPRATGPGHLWKMPGQRGKRHLALYDEERQAYHPAPELREQFEIKDHCLRKGEIPYFLFGSFPKDELIAPKKIAKVGAREITASQIDFCYCYRRYFGAFTACLRGSPLTWGHAMGLEIMGPGWDAIIKELLKNSPVGFDSDVKAFDSTIGAQIFYLFCDTVDLWYQRYDDSWKLEDRLARFALTHSIVFNYTVIGSTVSQSLMGNCSGQPGTIDINTVARKFFSRVAYDHLSREYLIKHPELAEEQLAADSFEFVGPQGYTNYVKAFGLGDDCIESVSPFAAEFYNYDSFAAYMKEFGVRITPAAKDKNTFIKGVKPVGQLEFLSCTTRRDNDLIPGISFYPCIKNSSLSKCVAYVRPNPELSEIAAAKSNIEDTLERAWFSGRERFDTFRNELMRDFYESYNIHHVFPSYEELLFRVAEKPIPLKRFYECQGITVSTSKVANHLTNVAESSVEANPDNSIEASTDLKARAGNDAPNVAQNIGGLTRIAYPPFSSGDGITFASTASIGAKLEKTVNTSLGDIDDLSFERFNRMTWSDSFSLASITSSGSVLASYPICPNQGLVGMLLNEERATSSMCYLSSLHTFWRGSINHSFHLICPGVGTARIAVCVLWDVHDIPPTTEELLSQAYAVYDLNSGSNVISIQIPYIATTEMLEVYNGQNDPEEYSAGTVAFILLNAYRAPESAPQIFDIEHFEGAGPDFQLMVPYGVNATLIPVYPGKPFPPPPSLRHEFRVPPNTPRVRKSTHAQRRVYETQMSDGILGPRVVNAESGLNEIIVMKTIDVASSPRANPICHYPQSVRHLMRRFTLVATTVQDIVLPHGGFFQISTPQPPGFVPISAMDLVTSPFGMWTGSMVYRFVSDARFTVSYRPKVNNSLHEGWQRYNGKIPPGRGPGLPVVFCKPEVGYVDMIVPFTSKFNACRLNAGVATPSEHNAVGDLIINFLGTPSLMNIFVSGGDGFNIGVPTLLPSLRTRPTNVAPDQYSSNFNFVQVDVSDYSDSKVERTYHTQMDTPDTKVSAPSTETIGAIMVEHAPVDSSVQDMKVSNEHKFIAQPQLDFQDYMRRPQLIATFDWSITHSVGAKLYGRDLPFGMLANTARRAKEAFRLFRGDIVVTIKLNGTIFHAGRLVASFTPLLDTNADTALVAHKNQRTWIPHIFADAQASTSATLRVPYRFYTPLVRTTDNSKIGSYNITVFSPLSVGAGGFSTIEVSIFVHFENPELRVINPIL